MNAKVAWRAWQVLMSVCVALEAALFPLLELESPVSNSQVVGYLVGYSFIGVILLAFVYLVVFVDGIVTLDDGAVLIWRANGEIHELIHEKTFRWKRQLRNVFISSFADFDGSLTMEITPITPNPKVRKISYKVNFIAKASNKVAFRALSQWVREKFNHFLSPTSYAIEQRLQYELYEFNEANSKEIAEFYNPMDKEQQSRFKELISQFLRAKAPEYIVFTDASFILA